MVSGRMVQRMLTKFMSEGSRDRVHRIVLYDKIFANIIYI